MKKSKELLRIIIERIQLGETLTSICREKDQPGLTTVYKWMNKDDDFKKELLEARRIGAMTWLDKMTDLLNQDIKPQEVQWCRERLHHSRWMASKLVSVFNDKVINENVGDPIIKIVWDDDSSSKVSSDKRKEESHSHELRGSDQVEENSLKDYKIN